MEESQAIDHVWQDAKQIKERTKFLLDNLAIIPTDVTFRVGQDDEAEDISGHRLILGIGSPVFYAMFYGDVDLRVKLDEVVRLPEIEPEAFRVVIAYLYTECTAELNMDNVMDTIYCAKKYLVLSLLERCRDFVQDNLTPDTACLVLAKADSFREENISQLASITINSLTSEVINSPSFLNLPEQHLRHFLTRDGLSINENAVYQAARKWVRHQTGSVRVDYNREFRKIFGRIVGDIRLPLMTPSQIANGPAKDKVLDHPDLSELFCFKFADDKPAIRYSAEPRFPPSRLRYVIMDLTRYTFDSAGDEERESCEITVEVRCDIAPETSKHFIDLCRGDGEEFFVKFGSMMFVSVSDDGTHYKKDDVDRTTDTFPVENHILRNTPGMVSFRVYPGENGARKEEVQICHPNEALTGNICQGMVFGRVIAGLDKMAALESGLTGAIDFQALGTYFYYSGLDIRVKRRLFGQPVDVSDDDEGL